MQPMNASAQERRTERVTLMVTPLEKRAVRFVAKARGLTESDVLRAARPEDIVAEYRRLVAMLREALGEVDGPEIGSRRHGVDP